MVLQIFICSILNMNIIHLDHPALPPQLKLPANLPLPTPHNFLSSMSSFVLLLFIS